MPHRHDRLRVLAVGLLPAVALTGGCTLFGSAPREAIIETDPEDTAAPAYTGVIPSAWVFAAGPETDVFAELDPISADRIATRRVETSGIDPDGLWATTLTREVPGAEPVLIREQVLSRLPTGAVAIETTISTRDETGGGGEQLIVYDPPFQLFPQQLAPDQTFEHFTTIAQHDPLDISRVIRRGSAERVVMRVSDDERDKVFPGKSGVAIREDIEIKFPEAQVTRRGWKLIDPTRGRVIAERVQSTTKVLFGLASTAEVVVTERVD